jgi:hypothetical protein
MNGNTSTNQTAITMITGTIAIMALLCVVTICVLSYLGVTVPPELNTLTGGLCGALTAMLVKTTPTETPKTPNPDAPAPVTVVNPPSDPVPTTEQKIDKPFGL